MSERVAVQDEISRSATTYPLDQRIDRYQSIHWTLRSGTGSVISQRPSARSLLWGNAMKKMTAPIPFDGSQLDQTRHISAFFNSADEEYRVLLPGGCFGRSDLRNARKVGFSQKKKKKKKNPFLLMVLSSTKRVISPLSSIAPMKNIESCSQGAASAEAIFVMPEKSDFRQVRLKFPKSPFSASAILRSRWL